MACTETLPCASLACVECEPGSSDPNCVRFKLEFFPWSRRQELICGLGRHYLYALSPHGKQFVVTPQLTEDTILKVVWDGYKYAWNDADTINFPEEASEAVAAYVQWKIALNVDKNIQLAREFEATYVKLRLALFRDFNDSLYVDGDDEEYSGTIEPPTDATISSWAELAAVPTTGLATGTVKIWVNDAEGLMKGTQLLAGTDATDTANGIQRPDDYADPGNARVWYNKLA